MQEQTNIAVPDGTIPADVDLAGLDGNAGSIMGAVARGLKRVGNPPHVIDSYRAQSMAADYDHLLTVAMHFVGDVGPLTVERDGIDGEGS